MYPHVSLNHIWIIPPTKAPDYCVLPYYFHGICPCFHFQICTRQGSDVLTVDSSLAVIHSSWTSLSEKFDLGWNFLGWNLKYKWMSGKIPTDFRWSKILPSEVMLLCCQTSGFQGSHVSQKQSLKWGLCFSHATEKRNQLMPPENLTSFVLANANESSVDAVLSQKLWECLVCHIKPLRKRFCFSTANK